MGIRDPTTAPILQPENKNVCGWSKSDSDSTFKRRD